NLLKDRESQSYSSPAQAQMGEIVESAMSRIAGDDSWQRTWQVRAGATYRWNGLLPFDKTGYREEEEELRTDEINILISQLKEAVANSVRRNYFSFKTAITTLDIRRENISTAEEGLRIAKESYRAGIIKNSELLSAEATLSGTRAAYIDALYSYYTYLAELEREAGTGTESILFEAEHHE
ncbi:MAG TPA: TolC family protein, partial [Spirochaetota bacterium]|nr:TolC family protein [Spirochaetota bacterium]